MRTRKQPLGDRNIVGAKIEAKRKELANEIVSLATMHTGNPKEGDYLRYGNVATPTKFEYQLLNHFL